MKILLLIACGAIMLLVLASCEHDFEGDSMPFVNLREADHFTVTTPETMVIREDSAWNALWECCWTLHSDSGKMLAPVIDFEHDMVIAVFWGFRPAGCHDWVEAIEHVRVYPDMIEIHIGPLPDLGRCAMVVYPLQMIKIRKSSLPVVFTGLVPGR